MTTNNGQIKPKLDVFSTFLPLINILRVFGLSCVSRDGDNIKYSPAYFRVVCLLISLLLINLFSIYFKFPNNKFTETNFSFEDFLEIIFLFGYIQYILDIICVNKYGKVFVFKYIKLYEVIDKTLGMTSHKEIKRSIHRMFLFFILTAFISSITDIVIWSLSYGWLIQVAYIIDYVYIFLKLLSDLDLIANCIQIKYRLQTIGDLLKQYYNRVNNSLGEYTDLINNEVCRPTLNVVENQENVIISLRRCYSLLVEQCLYINTIYGFRIIFSSMIHLTDLILMMNLMIRLISGNLSTKHDTGYLTVISTAMQILAIILVVFSVIHNCELNYQETERILRFIDHLLLSHLFTIVYTDQLQTNQEIHTCSQEVRDSLKELRDLIITRPIKFHAINFFKLEYPTLVSVASTIATYTIIVLQNIE